MSPPWGRMPTSCPFAQPAKRAAFTRRAHGHTPAMARPAQAPGTRDEHANEARHHVAEQDAPTPQPEREEPRLHDPDLGELSKRDYLAIMVRGAKEALDDNVTNLAAAVAYYIFLSIPSALLVAVGAFSLFAGPNAINTIVDHLSTVMPKSAVNLLADSLTRTIQAQSGGLIMICVGLALAFWTLSGAMQTVMWALNAAYT